MKRILLASVAALAVFAMFAAAGAAAQDEAKKKPTSRPATEGFLRNEVCPVSGDETVPELFVVYADDKKGVYAQVHVCCDGCIDTVKEGDLKATYEKFYLTKPDGKKVAYGKTTLAVKNEICPISGEATSGTEQLNYNAAAIELCCPMCTEEFVKHPDKYLHNVHKWVDKALAARKAKDEAKSKGE